MKNVRKVFVCVALAMLVLAGVSQAVLITQVARGGGSTNTPPALGGLLVDYSGAMVDRSHAYTAIPASLAGAEYVKVANSDKSRNDYTLNVTLSAAADVYLFIDFRIGNGACENDPLKPGYPTGPNLTTVMNWVLTDGFEDTGLKIALDENPSTSLGINAWYEIYKKSCSAGTVTLGVQNDGGSRNMYGVAAIPEPASMLILALGGLMALKKRK